MKERNKYGTSGELSWQANDSKRGVRIRGDKGNFQINPDGSETIGGANKVRVTNLAKSTDVRVPPAQPPKTLDRGYSPLPNWTPKGPGTRTDTGRASDGQRFPKERRPDRGR